MKEQHQNFENYFLSPEQKGFHYAQAVKRNGVIYVSGSVSMDEAGNPIAVGDMPQQVRTVYRTIERTLAQSSARAQATSCGATANTPECSVG